MNKVKLEATGIQIIDGDRGANYPKKSDFTKDGYCVFLDASNVTKDGFNLDAPAFIAKDKSESLRNGKLSRNDIVLTTRGTIGNFAYFNEAVKYDHVRINSGMLILRSSDEFDPEYLYYLLRSNLIGEQIKAKTTGSSQPQITVGIVKDLTLLQPEKTLQQKIARVIANLDKKIAMNRKINTELEAIARDLYNYWFVQFDFPDANNRPYKTAGGALVYNEELKREIPADWQVETLYKNTLTEIIKPKIDVFSGQKMYLDTSTVNDLAIGVGEQITYSNRASRANMQPVANSVWFAKMQNSVKHVIVGEWSKDLIDSSILSTGFMGLTVKEHALAYIAGYIRNPYFEIVKDSNSHGATMSGIGNDDMKNIRLILPPENVLHEFSKSTNKLWQQIDKNRQENQRLIALRDWLLPMLMNGQVEVSQ